MEENREVERQKKIRDLFEEAFYLPADKRSAFLEETCGQDKGLLQEVSTLLKEADSEDPSNEALLDEVVWPALESLSQDPAKLQAWLQYRDSHPLPDEPDSDHTEQALFMRCLEIAPDKRLAFLEAQCQGDTDLQERILTLLKSHENAGSFFESLLDEDAEALAQKLERTIPSEESQGDHIGPYQLLELIGEGAWGSVWRAQQTGEIQREVAIKILKLGLDTKEFLARFEVERRILGLMDHPNIAHILDAGATAYGRPYFVMELVKGMSLIQYADQHRLSIRQRLELFIQICRAVQHAHQRGIIHRDLKPSNILVTVVDDKPVPKIIDFGVAKTTQFRLTDKTLFTGLHTFVGTPVYSSPEQLEFYGLDVDPRSDIYSLGVLLYELLCGQTPFAFNRLSQEGMESFRSLVREEDPPRPSQRYATLTPEEQSTYAEKRHLTATKVPSLLKGDLDWIVMKCLEKDRTRRYESAHALADDLQAFLDDRPVSAAAPSFVYCIQKFVTRNRLNRAAWLAVPAVLLAWLTAVFIFSEKESRPTAQQNQPVTFTRITEGPLVEDAGHFFAPRWGDYDGDGLIDVAVTDNSEEGGLHLYRNAGGGRFERVTEGVLATDPVSPWILTWVDYDNDGDLDAFVTTEEKTLNSFYRNDGAGIFTKITEGHWVNTPAFSQTGSWGDYDNDGWLDLYVTNSGLEEAEANFLYHNRGNGTMERIENETTRFTSISHAGTWSDFDGDRDLDLLVAGQDPLIFRNDSAGTFTGLPADKGGIPEFTEDTDIGLATVDYDNDGDLDVFYTTWKPEAGILVFRNDQNRLFKPVADILPSQGQARAMGQAWGDYDNDGFQDVFVTNFIGKNLLYHNTGSGRFERVMDSPVVDSGNASTAAAWVDYDNDGDLDLSVANGLWSQFPQTCELYRNEGNGNHWITVSLHGTTSNRSGIGAKIFARARISGIDMLQLRELQCGGYPGSGTPRAHFGLGNATVVDTLRIEWPSGQVQEMRNIAANQFLTITETSVADERYPTEKKDSSVTFTRITEGPLVQDTGKFAGFFWGDYDNDGYPDLILANEGGAKTLHQYRNNGDGTFDRITDGILATDSITPFGLYSADQDNDGDLDLYVTTDSHSPNAFYRNQGNGQFEKETGGDWIALVTPSCGMSWGDYDRDGFVDLYVANAGQHDPQRNFLFHNQGDGSMVEIQTEANHVAGVSFGCLWSDYNNDGYLDLFVAGQDPVQYRNNGDGTFTGISGADYGIPEYTQDTDIGFAGADYDNDGDMDYFYILWNPDSCGRLYRNEKNHTFKDVTFELPSEEAVRVHGAAWGDYDNDGFIDLMVTTPGKNLLYHNEGDGTFAKVLDSIVVSKGMTSSGAAWVDYDNDGDLDLFTANGMWDTFEQSCELFRNEGNSNRWINLKLIGTVSNRSAIGAKVFAQAAIRGNTLTQMRELQVGGNGQNGTDMRIHFGLGDATVVDTLRIEWPSSIVQELHDVEVDQFLTITEQKE